MATFQTYPVPSPGYASSYYRTPPQTPPPAGTYYYSPRNFSYTSIPSVIKGHTRRATNDGPHSYAYAPSPRKPHHPRSTPEPTYSSYAQPPPRKSDYVSGSDCDRSGARYYYYYRTSTDAPKKHHPQSTSKQPSSRPKYHVKSDDYYYDRSYEDLPRYQRYEQQPPPYHRQPSFHEARTDRRCRDQVPIYSSAESTQNPRPRRASFTGTQQPTNPPPRPQSSSQHRPSTASQPPPKATEEDARRAGIPAGYSYKNWDPTEEPILLLGSVFDANSLGKWIYDWTVFFYGPATPMAEVAGELWLLLIQLAHKVKRGEETLPRIRSPSSRDMIDEFLESGERLWQRFNKLLKICENYMWKAAKKESGSAKTVTMGKNSGSEFVDTIFGRDRELERTEKLMTGMRLWSMRFDANCEEILRNAGK